jgi:hypothetical protein
VKIDGVRSPHIRSSPDGVHHLRRLRWSAVPVGAGARPSSRRPTRSGVVTSSLSFTFDVQSITDYQPAVTRPSETVRCRDARSLVHGPNAGSRSATFALAASCGAMAGCTPARPDDVGVGRGMPHGDLRDAEHHERQQ